MSLQIGPALTPIRNDLSTQEPALIEPSTEFQLPTEETLENELIQTFVQSGVSPTEARSAADLFLESMMMMMLHSIQHSAEQAHQNAKQNRLIYDT